MGLSKRASLRQLFAIYLIASCAHINWATAQNSINLQGKTACTTAKDIRAPQMYGLWQVTFTNPPAGLPASATLMLEKHEEFSDSLQGVVTRKLRAGKSANAKDGHAAKAALAGDVEDGFVILDESSNNISISGTWNGQLVEGSCGREVTGLWKDTSASASAGAGAGAGASESINSSTAVNSPDVPFTMKKVSAW